jgi:hypothetical protein
MTTLEEKRGAGFHIVSEANGSRSREEIVVASGAGELEVGTILGQVTATENYVQLDPEAEDGSGVAACILWDKVDATSEDKDAVAHLRDCEVMGSELVYPDGSDEDAINLELSNLGIIVR